MGTCQRSGAIQSHGTAKHSCSVCHHSRHFPTPKPHADPCRTSSINNAASECTSSWTLTTPDTHHLGHKHDQRAVRVASRDAGAHLIPHAAHVQPLGSVHLGGHWGGQVVVDEAHLHRPCPHTQAHAHTDRHTHTQSAPAREETQDRGAKVKQLQPRTSGVHGSHMKRVKRQV